MEGLPNFYPYGIGKKVGSLRGSCFKILPEFWALQLRGHISRARRHEPFLDMKGGRKGGLVVVDLHPKRQSPKPTRLSPQP